MGSVKTHRRQLLCVVSAASSVSGAVLTALALCVTISVASAAQPPVREVDSVVGARKVVQKGTLATMGQQSISLAGRGRVLVKDVAKAAFEEDDALKRELQAGRAGLLADPVVESDVVETDTATILSTTTRAVVTDPEKVRRASPQFARIRGGKEKAKLSELDQKVRQSFDEFYQEAKSFGPKHPLRIAADQSEQALLDAVVAGKGDLAITTTIVIPKNGRTRDGKGKLVRPKRSADGSMEFTQTQAAPLQRLTQVGTVEDATAGTKTTTSKFLTGFTEGDQWEWARRWDFATGGYFRVKASAWYDYGLRVPMQIKSTVEPTSIQVKGTDTESEYEVKLEGSVLDGSKTFYDDVGLTSSEVHDGNELVLQAGLQVTFTLRLLGTSINETLPKNDAFDFSQDFRPPFGDCGTNCGFNVWIPAEITHTSVNILGIIKGSARAGVNVSGNGTASVDFEALTASDVTESWAPGDKQNAAKKRRVSFTNAGQAKTQLCTTPKLPKDVSSREYGYRLSAPHYDWNIVLTPGVRADVDIRLWPIKESITVQPLWLNALAIRLGHVALGPHAGTKSTYVQKPGRKSKPPVPVIGNAKVPGAPKP